MAVSPKGSRALLELMEDCRLARSAAQSATLARSKAAWRRALATRLTSRRHLEYARIEGVLDGVPTVAVVRSDGSVLGERRLLERMGLVTSLGETFAGTELTASTDLDPLASTLTATRACDRVRTVAIYGGCRNEEAPERDAGP